MWAGIKIIGMGGLMAGGGIIARGLMRGAGGLLSAGKKLLGRGGKKIVNIGGEGESAGALNVQGQWITDASWRTSRNANVALGDLKAAGNEFIIADNTALPFTNRSIDKVITNSVPIDTTTHLGPGVQSSEIWRILKDTGPWIRNGEVVPRP